MLDDVRKQNSLPPPATKAEKFSDALKKAVRIVNTECSRLFTKEDSRFLVSIGMLSVDLALPKARKKVLDMTEDIYVKHLGFPADSVVSYSKMKKTLLLIEEERGVTLLKDELKKMKVI